MVTSIIGIILGVVQAIPIFNTWLQQLMVAYATSKLDSMKAENFAALKKAITEKDQRDLEAALGNPNAGGASGYGTIVKSLPGVPGASK